MIISTEQLEAIRQRAEKATAGPWIPALMHDGWYVMHDGLIVAEMYREEGPDANFIANARHDVPKLIDEIDRLRRQNHELFAELRQRDEEDRQMNGIIGALIGDLKLIEERSGGKVKEIAREAVQYGERETAERKRLAQPTGRKVECFNVPRLPSRRT